MWNFIVNYILINWTHNSYLRSGGKDISRDPTQSVVVTGFGQTNLYTDSLVDA